MHTGSKKIKVVFVVNDFMVGGTQRLLINLLSFIDRSTFDVSLITLFSYPERPTLYGEIPKDIPISRLSFRGFTDLRSWGALCKTLRVSKPDIVFSHLYFANTATRILQPFLQYQSIITEHNTYVGKTGTEKAIDRFLSHFSKRIVAVSETVKTFTSKQEHIRLSKFEVIHNGIDIARIKGIIAPYERAGLCDELGLNTAKKYMVSVARLTKQKNPALLIDGFDLFAAENTDYELLVVGDGGMKDEIEKYAKQKASTSRIHFFGSRTDVYKFYCVSDFFISTSDIEGFGIAHIEAMACSIPVVTTKTAGPDEFIREGKNGYFIKNKTPEAVQESINLLVFNNPVIMREECQKTADQYNIKEMVKRYEVLFASIVI